MPDKSIVWKNALKLGVKESGSLAEYRIPWPLHQVQQIIFSIAEEQHAASTAGGFNGVGELHAFLFQGRAGLFNGIHLQGEMTPAVEGVVAGFLERGGALINLQHETAREGHEISG